MLTPEKTAKIARAIPGLAEETVMPGGKVPKLGFPFGKPKPTQKAGKDARTPPDLANNPVASERIAKKITHGGAKALP